MTITCEKPAIEAPTVEKLWKALDSHPSFGTGLIAVYDSAVTKQLKWEGREYSDRVPGTTGFFRAQKYQENVLLHLMSEIPPDRPLRILIAPGSIGCEALSAVMVAHHIDPERAIEVDSIDISQGYRDFAVHHSYPSYMLEHISEEYKKHFNKCANSDFLRISEDISSRVNYLPAGDILKHEPDAPYDAVFALNLLVHVGDKQAAPMMRKLAALSDGLLCVNHISSMDISSAVYRDLRQELHEQHGFSLLNREFSRSSLSGAFPKKEDYKSSRTKYVERDWAFNFDGLRLAPPIVTAKEHLILD